MEAFAQSLLHVGNGTSASTGGSHAVDWSTGWLPDDSTAALIDAIYSDLSYRSPKFFTFRAILCTLNKNVAYFNRQVLEKFPGGAKIVCISRDQVINQEDSFLLPTKTMNAFKPASLPPDSNNLHAPFRRVQYPVRLAFSMTINKSQGQSLQHVGLCLHPKVFAHGQLYVALSCVTSKAGLSIVAPGKLPQKQPTPPARCIKNKVIKQILLPQAT